MNRVSHVSVCLVMGVVVSEWTTYIDGVVGEAYDRTQGKGVKMIDLYQRKYLLSQILFVDDTTFLTVSTDHL